MATLTAAARRKIPPVKFAGPDGSYPIEDKPHAVDAEGRAEQAVEAGRMSPAERDRIDAKAQRMIHPDDPRAVAKRRLMARMLRHGQ